MIDRVKAMSLWEKALVIVTADHGVAFEPGLSRRNIVPLTAGDIAGVPMFVKAPGQREGRVENGGARTVDLVPTIGDYLGARWDLPGESLRTPPTRREIDVWVGFGRR